MINEYYFIFFNFNKYNNCQVLFLLKDYYCLDNMLQLQEEYNIKFILMLCIYLLRFINLSKIIIFIFLFSLYINLGDSNKI